MAYLLQVDSNFEQALLLTGFCGGKAGEVFAQDCTVVGKGGLCSNLREMLSGSQTSGLNVIAFLLVQSLVYLRPQLCML